MSAAWTDAIARLVAEGGDDNHAIFGEDEGFVIVRGAPGADSVTIELPSDRHLPAGTKIAPGGLERLHQAGFRRPTAARPFRATRPFDVEALGTEVADLVRGVYGVESEAVRVHLGARETQENPVLIEAMRHLSRTRDMGARQGVYRTLLEARLLTPLARPVEGPHGALGVDLELRVSGELGGRPTMDAFTDIDTLRRDHPRSLPYVVLSGQVLVPLLVARRAGSLLINPGGDVGGELYANEIEALQAYLQRPARSH